MTAWLAVFTLPYEQFRKEATHQISTFHLNDQIFTLRRTNSLWPGEGQEPTDQISTFPAGVAIFVLHHMRLAKPRKELNDSF